MADIRLFIRSEYDASGVRAMASSMRQTISSMQTDIANANEAMKQFMAGGEAPGAMGTGMASGAMIKSLKDQNVAMIDSIELAKQQAMAFAAVGQMDTAQFYANLAREMENVRRQTGLADEFLAQETALEKTNRALQKLRGSMKATLAANQARLSLTEGEAKNTDMMRESINKLIAEYVELRGVATETLEGAIVKGDEKAIQKAKELLAVTDEKIADNQRLAQSMGLVNKEQDLNAQTIGKTTPQLKELGRQWAENDVFQLKNVDSARKVVIELDKMAHKKHIDAMKALKDGQIGSAVALKAQAEQLRQTAREWAAYSKNLGVASGILSGLGPRLTALIAPISRIGFSAFILTQNFKTFAGAFVGLFNAIEAGVNRIVQKQIAQTIMNSLGPVGQEIKQSLLEASDGFISAESAIKSFTSVASSGNQKLTEALPRLLNIAKGAAIMKGEVGQTQQIYEKLVDGIQKGSALKIDDAKLFIRVGAAVREYAESLGKTEDQLTPMQRQQAILNVVLQEGGELYEDIGANIETAATKMAKFKRNMVELKNAGVDAFVETLIEQFEVLGLEGPESFETLTTWVKAFGASLATVITGGIKLLQILKESLTILSDELRKLQAPFTNFWANMADPNVSVLDGIKQFGSDLNTVFEDQFQNGFVGIGEDSLEQLKNVWSEGFQDFGDLFAVAVENTHTEVVDTIEGVEPPKFQIVSSDSLDEARAHLEYLLSDKYKFDKQIEEAEDDHQQRLDELVDEGENKRYELALEFSRKRVDLREDYNRKLEDLELEKERALEDLAEDNADKEQDIIEKYNRKKEDLEEEHQRKLRDIQRKFELSRLKAILDRNAKALFTAIATRDKEIDSENDRYKDKNKDAKDQYEEELEELEEKEEDQRKALQKSYERKKKDAEKAWKERLEDEKKNYDRQLRDLARELAEQEAELNESFNRRIQDMEDNYNEQQMLQQAEQLLQEIEQENHQEVMEGLVDEHLQTLMDLEQEYYDFASGWREDLRNQHQDLVDVTLPEGSNGGNGGNGGSGGQGVDPCQYPLGPCVTHNRYVVCSDGRVFRCNHGQWVEESQQGPPAPGTNNPQTQPTGSNNGGGGGGQNVNLTITVTGDQTMSDFFKALAYEAVMEIL